MKFLNRNLFKRFIAVSLASVLIFCITACSDKEAQKQKEESRQAKRNTVVMKIGDIEISQMDFQVCYYNSYNDFLNSNIPSHYGLDTSKSLSEQAYYEDSSITWADYFVDQTIENCKVIFPMINEAVKQGFELNQEGIDNVNRTLDNFRENVKQQMEDSGKKEDEVVEDTYGEDAQYEDLKKIFEYMELYGRFCKSITDGYTFTEEEKSDYYNENKDDIDTVTARVVPFVFATPEIVEKYGLQEGKYSTREEAQKRAEDFIGKITDPSSFVKIMMETLTEEEISQNINRTGKVDFSYNTNMTKSSLGMTDEGSRWLFDESRRNGDIAVIEADGAYLAVCFIERDNKNFNLCNVRHIMFSGNTDENKLKAQTVYNQWKDGEATEESFAKLAEEFSQDPISSDNGGMFENLYKGRMPKPFNDWCFDSSRKPGDTEIIKTSYGYHIMYYSGTGVNYRNALIAEKMAAEKFSEYENVIKSKYGYEENKERIMEVTK